MSLKYQIRDLICTTAEFGSRTFLIFETTKTGYLAIETKTKKRYPIEDIQIASKIGEIEADHPLLSSYKDEYNIRDGETYCLSMMVRYPLEASKWKILKQTKPGDQILLIHRKTIYPGEFVKINFEKPAFPIRAKIKGLVRDFRLDAIVES